MRVAIDHAFLQILGRRRFRSSNGLGIVPGRRSVAFPYPDTVVARFPVGLQFTIGHVAGGSRSYGQGRSAPRPDKRRDRGLDAGPSGASA